MAGEWRKATIGELAEMASGKGLPKSKYSERGTFPVMGSNGLLGWCEQPLYEHPVITIGRVGACGEIHKTSGPAWVSDNALVTIPREGCDFFYLYYLLKSTDFSSIIGGTTQPLITQTAVKRLDVRVPPLREQQAIACILGALDDKIDLHRRMNQTLDAMAQAIFKSWFVNFDPVRAKTAGQQPPGLKPEIAALFPAAFEDSELGEIPRGWRVANIEDIGDVGSGKRPTGRSDVMSSECNIPLYGGGGRMGYVSSPLYEKPILFTGRVGTLGLIFRTAEPSWPSDNTLVIEPRNGFFDFIYFVLKGFDLITLNRGSTQPLLTQTDLKRQQAVVPSATILKLFSDLSVPIFQQVAATEMQAHTIVALRDALLPKLISGELPVPDAERIIGRAV